MCKIGAPGAPTIGAHMYSLMVSNHMLLRLYNNTKNNKNNKKNNN